VSDRLNVSIQIRPEADLPDLRALLRDRGVSIVTSREGEEGKLELIVIVDADAIEPLTDALPAGSSVRVLGVRAL
jgi:hypothetical protein